MKPPLIRVLSLKQPFLVGEDVEAIRRKCKLYLGEPLSSMPAKTSERRTFGPGMRDLVNRVRDDMAVTKNGKADNPFLALLRKDFAAGRDQYSDYLLAQYAAEHPLRDVPDLGPIYKGGRSLLLQDLTHLTDGVPGFPAFDDGWRAGRAVIAPERLTVTKQSDSQGGDAFFAEGVSTIEYWIGHVVQAPGNGREFAKGATMSTIANISLNDGGPHVHTGLNAKRLIGKELLHHTNYTHGAPSVGEQLRKWALG